MGNFKMRQLLIFILITFISCQRGKIKVVVDEYSQNKPRTIRYFNSQEDSKTFITVHQEDGKGIVSKPLSFDEEFYYENGKLQYKGQYLNGQTSGLWEYYYETGLRQAKCYYQNNQSTDTVNCWYPSGKIKRIIIEIDTTNNYWHNVDYNENGNKSYDCYQTKVADKDSFYLNGKFQEWHQNGQLKLTATFKNGTTVGKWQKFDETGKLIEESEKPYSISIY